MLLLVRAGKRIEKKECPDTATDVSCSATLKVAVKLI